MATSDALDPGNEVLSFAVLQLGNDFLSAFQGRIFFDHTLFDFGAQAMV